MTRLLLVARVLNEDDVNQGSSGGNDPRTTKEVEPEMGDKSDADCD